MEQIDLGTMRASTADADLQAASVHIARYLERAGKTGVDFLIHWKSSGPEGEYTDREAIVVVAAKAV